MTPHHNNSGLVALVLAGASLWAASCQAQFSSSSSNVNYIDSALVQNRLRLRFDAGFDNEFPDRAEFFYAQCGCFGGDAPGPPLPETAVDYQDLMAYGEIKLLHYLSAFVEAGARFLDPEVNTDENGFADMTAGFKLALISNDCQTLTAQLKVYAPTGDPFRGLGTGHASVEPGALYFRRLNQRLTWESELRLWVPFSDSEFNGEHFAGSIIRYGVGLGYELYQSCGCCGPRQRLTGVAELVGWTVLDGQQFNPNFPNDLDASGITIVNAKGGLRWTSGQHSVAGSAGFPLTDDFWYREIYRLEYRFDF